MKTLFLIFLFVSAAFALDSGVVGKVEPAKGCSNEVMVWLSLDKENFSERLLLSHTAVPVNGKFQFYLKPGNYQLRASDEEGCEYFQRLKIGHQMSSVIVKMVKK